MNQTPNFKEYSYETLLDVHGYIDGQRFPDRKKEVERLIEQKKDSDEAKAYHALLKEKQKDRKYKTFWPRLIAGLIDGAILTLISIAISSITEGTAAWVISSGELISIFLIYIYSISLHSYSGQTIGKYLTSLKVVKNSNEENISVKQAFLRDSVPLTVILFTITLITLGEGPSTDNLSYFHYALLGVGIFNTFWYFLELVTMLVNKKRRAVHDYIAKTVVINLY